MKKSNLKLGFLAFAALALTSAYAAKPVEAAKQTSRSYSMMTKAPGTKSYGIYKRVSGGKAKGKITTTSDFKTAHIESNRSIKTKKYTYWYIYVNGRAVGWVNQNWFQRSTIKAAKSVSLVNNPHYSFNTRDAISYATNSQGTVVSNSKVKASVSKISSKTAGNHRVTFSYGKARATTNVTVRSDAWEGISSADLTPVSGTSAYKPPKSHFGTSTNYRTSLTNTPETHSHSLYADKMTFNTRLYQPVRFSLRSDEGRNIINSVGHINEGMAIYKNMFYSSLLRKDNDMQGHVVGYDLNKLKSRYNTQKLLTMSMNSFKYYSRHIVVSPLVPTGHGQAMGATSKYVYTLVNNHKKPNWNQSEELVQLNKKDLTINKIWTIKLWNHSDSYPRYLHNAVIVSDDTMYGLFHNGKTHYEFWEFKRSGDSWNATEVGAMNGNFVANRAPVQAFTYDPVHRNFYVGFNDYMMKVSRRGKFLKAYGSFHSGREIEGAGVANNHLYINFAQRAELLESNGLN